MRADIRTNTRSKQIRSFTLIELLVVISIIAILASILLPALQKAKQSSKKIVCASQLKQLGIGFTEYTLDHTYYPPLRSKTTGQLTSVAWGKVLAPYVGYNDINTIKRSNNIFSCPSDTINKLNNARSYRLVGGIITTAQGMGYGIGVEGTRPGMLHRPSETRLVSEVYYQWGAITNTNAACLRTDNAADLNSISIWHQKGSNYLFADGHVSWNQLRGPIYTDPSWYFNLK